MPVAYNQIEQVYKLFVKYVPTRTTRRDLFLDLQTTDAYRRNKSFAETIDRLIDLHNRSRKPAI